MVDKVIGSLKELLFESLPEVVSGIMSAPGGRTAAEVMVDLCYQEHPTSIADFVSISKVKKSSINL